MITFRDAISARNGSLHSKGRATGGAVAGLARTGRIRGAWGGAAHPEIYEIVAL